jgi:hypothetical protein
MSQLLPLLEIKVADNPRASEPAACAREREHYVAMVVQQPAQAQ